MRLGLAATGKHAAAIARGNIVMAEATARELGLSLEEASQLERAALRWFCRWLDESKGVSLLKAQIWHSSGPGNACRRRSCSENSLEVRLSV